MEALDGDEPHVSASPEEFRSDSPGIKNTAKLRYFWGQQKSATILMLIISWLHSEKCHNGICAADSGITPSDTWSSSGKTECTTAGKSSGGRDVGDFVMNDEE